MRPIKCLVAVTLFNTTIQGVFGGGSGINHDLLQDARKEAGVTRRPPRSDPRQAPPVALKPLVHTWKRLILEEGSSFTLSEICDHFVKILLPLGALPYRAQEAVFGPQCGNMASEIKKIVDQWHLLPAGHKSPAGLYNLLATSALSWYNFDLLCQLRSKELAQWLMEKFLKEGVVKTNVPWALRTFNQFRWRGGGRHYKVREVVASIASVANLASRDQDIRRMNVYGVQLEPPS